MSAPIIGANHVDQLNASLAASALQLPAAQLAVLEEASRWNMEA
jgi:aryl-alcohol dehydrogenase-like predicted oxidoreductase